MFRRLIAALFLFLPALPVFAAEDENEAVVIAAPAQTSAAESKITLPPCNDPALIAGVRRNLTAYYEANLDSTLIENRRRRLLLQNLSFFEPLDVTSFNDKENYQVADRIIMAKINRGAVPENMLLCRNEFKMRDEALYLLAYPFDGNLAVEIINFGDLSPDAEAGHFFIPLSE